MRRHMVCTDALGSGPLAHVAGLWPVRAIIIIVTIIIKQPAIIVTCIHIIIITITIIIIIIIITIIIIIIITITITIVIMITIIDNRA